MKKKEKYIGIFDSGIGGLTVANQVIKNLPSEKIIYLGDTARVPYGIKSKDTVIKFTKECVNFLLNFDLKALIIACNTASSYALSLVESNLDIPIFGVIEPGVKSAVKITKNKKIGVIGTRATINSKVYENKILEIDSGIEVFQNSCPLFVSLAEEGWIDDDVTYRVADRYLYPFKEQSIDTLILGCTHYPILKKVIKKIMGDKVTLIDSAESVAAIIRDTLDFKGVLDNNKVQIKQNRFFCTDEIERFIEVGKNFFSFNFSEVSRINLESNKITEKITI